MWVTLGLSKHGMHASALLHDHMQHLGNTMRARLCLLFMTCFCERSIQGDLVPALFRFGYLHPASLMLA